MDLDNQSLDHDEQLGVESLEDIIDVENEMGFGEGEEWSRDDSPAGYGKLAASRKRGLINKASAMHDRPRTKPLTIYPHRSCKPLTAVRHGHKHGVSSSSDGEERPQMRLLRVSPGINKHAFGPGSDSANKLQVKEEAKDDAIEMRGIFELDDNNDCSLRSSHDEEDMQGFCMDLESKVDSVGVVDASKHEGIEREMNGENAVQSDETERGKEHAHLEAKKGLDKQEEKTTSSNRVRFALDVETNENITGYANKRCTDAKEKAKCGKQQEWRYVRSTPSDSMGFGTTKAPAGVSAVKTTSGHRRKESEITKDPVLGFDLEKAIEMRNDKKAARLALERIERFEDAILKQQEIVANMKLSLTNEGSKDYTKLRQLVEALDRNIKKVIVPSKVHQVPQSYELKNRAEQINRLKAQCNLLETDRERLKKKLRHLLENADGKEREQEAPNKGRDSEAALNERENLLEEKVKGLESCLAEWEAKFKQVESDFAIERALLEDSLSVCKLDWRNKQQRWLSKMKEREAELSDMKASQDKLVDSLVSCRKCMDKLRREATSYGREMAPAHGAGAETQEEDMAPKSIENTNALGLAYSIQKDMESLGRLLAESFSVFQDNPRLQPEVLEKETKVLENKVAHTITLMTKVKQEMKAKEDQIKKENEKYAEVVAEKVNHVEALKDQLANKEQDMEGFIQELEEKVSLLNKELECERREKSRLSELQGNMKYKLLKGLRKKEQKLEEEVEGMKERLEEMKATLAQKDEGLVSLEEEVKAKCTQLAQEKQKWNMAIKEVKQKAAKTILRFMNGKENGLLEHLRERKKGHKTGEGRVGLSYKTDDNDDDDDDDDNRHEDKGSWMCQGLSKKSLREKLHSKRHQTRLLSAGGLEESPRDSHHLLSRNFDNITDLRSSFESHKERAKHAYDLFSRKEDVCLQETYPKALKLARRNRAMERRDD